MALAGVDDQHAGLARGVEHLAQRRDRRLQQRHVVAERLAEAAGLEKIPLHVDDDEGGVIELDRPAPDGSASMRLTPMTRSSARAAKIVQDRGQRRVRRNAAPARSPANSPPIASATEAST